jgi:hypothetical protein
MSIERGRGLATPTIQVRTRRLEVGQQVPELMPLIGLGT